VFGIQFKLILPLVGVNLNMEHSNDCIKLFLYDNSHNIFIEAFLIETDELNIKSYNNLNVLIVILLLSFLVFLKY
jgi:hypothetical protein